jgi:hypothetical protein
MDNHSGGNCSLTGALVKGSSCQNMRRGRGEKANTSKPTEYTRVASGA